MLRTRLTVAVDFDGVLATFTGWVGEYTFGTPMPGAAEFLKAISSDYRVVIFTARPDIADVWHWLNTNGMSEFVDDVTNVKPPAFAYIDDRAIEFRGNFTETLDTLNVFKPYWKDIDE